MREGRGRRFDVFCRVKLYSQEELYLLGVRDASRGHLEGLVVCRIDDLVHLCSTLD